MLIHAWPSAIDRDVIQDIAVNLVIYMPVGLFGFLALRQLHSRDFLNEGDQIADGHHFAGTEIDRCSDEIIAMHDHANPLHAVIDIHELRVCVPSPQITISFLPWSLASMTFRQIAAGAFSRPPSYVP